MLIAGFRKCHRRPQHRLPLGCELSELLVAASADCLWCGPLHRKWDQPMHLALPPSHCKPVLSSIPILNNPVGLSLETWLAIVGTATSDPLPRETIVLEIFNFTWTMKSSVMLEILTTSFIQRHCRSLRYAFPVRRPSKMKGPISWSSRTAHHTLTLKRSWKLLSTVAWDSHLHTHESCVYYWHRRDWIALHQ